MHELVIRIGGAYCFGFVMFHMMFWKLFRWKADLQRLSSVNRAIMQVLNIQLTYVFAVAGMLILMFTDEMITTGLGRTVLGATSIFWFLRAVEQTIFFDMKRTASRIILIVFIAGGALFLYPLLVD